MYIPSVWKYTDGYAILGREGKFLELGSGTGQVPKAVFGPLENAYFPKVEWIASDFSPQMIEKLKSNLHFTTPMKLDIQEIDAQKIPLEDASVERVLSNFAMMFVPDKDAAFKEIHRVLKPEGRLCFSVWSKFENNPAIEIIYKALDDVAIKDDSRKFVPNIKTNPNFSLSDAPALESKLREVGFEHVQIIPERKFHGGPLQTFVLQALNTFPMNPEQQKAFVAKVLPKAKVLLENKQAYTEAYIAIAVK